MRKSVLYILIQLLLLSTCYSLLTDINDYLIVGKWVCVYIAMIAIAIYCVFIYSSIKVLSNDLLFVAPTAMFVTNSIVIFHCMLQLTAILPNNTTFPATAGFGNPVGVAVIATLFSFIPWFTAQTRWYKLSTSLDSTTAGSKHLTEYEALLSTLGRSEYFLYNYAVELHYAGYDDKADSIMHLCEAKRRDYNTTLLRGDIYDKLNNFQKADSCYKLCCDMCPARFIPLYNRFNLYKQRQDSTMMKQIGNEILNKPIKVSSKEVRSIRLKIRQEMLGL